MYFSLYSSQNASFQYKLSHACSQLSHWLAAWLGDFLLLIFIINYYHSRACESVCRPKVFNNLVVLSRSKLGLSIWLSCHLQSHLCKDKKKNLKENFKLKQKLTVRIFIAGRLKSYGSRVSSCKYYQKKEKKNHRVWLDMKTIPCTYYYRGLTTWRIIRLACNRVRMMLDWTD